jgi:hypothetical protein
MNNAFKNFSSSTKKTQQKDPFIKKREPVINFNRDDFPDLVNHNTSLLEKEPKKSLDYKGASLIHDDKPQEEEKQPGWTYITMDKNRNIQIENYKVRSKYISQYNKEPTWSNILSHLVMSWDKYKEKYIQLYGEDCYNNMYEMPNDDYKYYDDDDENKDDISSGDEQDYYDENNDDYDNYL